MALPYVNNIYFILFFRVGKGCEEEGGGGHKRHAGGLALSHLNVCLV